MPLSKVNKLKQVTINVHSHSLHIMHYGEFCKEQAENEGMRFDVTEVDGEWKASGYHINSSSNESFEEFYSSEEDAELHCQEVASEYLNNNLNYISATYTNAKEAAVSEWECENTFDLEDCTLQELEEYITNEFNKLI